jgi:hypothetical protein
MKKSRKKTTFRKSVGKLLLDMGKLVSGGIIIGGILRGEVPPVILIVCGSVAASIFFILGLHFTTKKKKKTRSNL